nr:NS2 [Red mite densovirus 1]
MLKHIRKDGQMISAGDGWPGSVKLLKDMETLGSLSISINAEEVRKLISFLHDCVMQKCQASRSPTTARKIQSGIISMCTTAVRTHDQHASTSRQEPTNFEEAFARALVRSKSQTTTSKILLSTQVENQGELLSVKCPMEQHTGALVVIKTYDATAYATALPGDRWKQLQNATTCVLSKNSPTYRTILELMKQNYIKMADHPKAEFNERKTT